MRKIKIAQIGVAHDHAPAIMLALTSQKDIFDVVGYCDPEQIAVTSPATGKRTIGGYAMESGFVPKPELYEGIPFLTLDEILNMKDLDAVCIETSETNLFYYAQMAAEHGLNVHMDKPGGTEYKDFEKLVNTFKKTGKVLHLGYMYRYNPEVQKAIKEIEAGKYGDIYSVECQMSACHPDEKRAWMANYKGGMMFFLGCHLVDLIYRIQGEPEEIIPYNCCTGTNGVKMGEDYGFAVFKYPNGISFAKTCAAEPGAFLRRQFVVCGTKGTLEFKPFEGYDGPIGSASLCTYVRDVHDDFYNWGNDGEHHHTSYDRFMPMMASFAELVCGEKENPYTMDYELKLYRLIMKACGREVE